MQSLYGAIANTNKKEIMVLIDKVYQKVLAIANKEQRGYITPHEFNLFADQAQMEIFEQYFYDVEQFERRIDATSELTKRKIEIFRDSLDIAVPTQNSPYAEFHAPMLSAIGPIAPARYLIDSVSLSRPNGKRVTVEKIDGDSQHTIHEAISASPLLSPNESRPVYWITAGGINFLPSSIVTQGNQTGGSYRVNFIREPLTPEWAYVIADGQNAVYNPANVQNFELHSSEESSLVIKILQLAGVAIKDVNLDQIAGAKEAATEQQQKQ